MEQYFRSCLGPMLGDSEEVSLLSAAALSSLMQSDCCPPLVLEAVMGHSSSGHAFIPGAVLFSLSEIDVCLEDEMGSPLPIAGNYCLRGPIELRRALERHGVQAGRRVVVYTQCRRHTTVRGQALGERGHHHRYRPAAAREGVADVIVAARLVWCLAYAGVMRVALLDGGMSGWLALGLPTAAAPSPPAPIADFCGDGGEAGGGGGEAVGGGEAGGGEGGGEGGGGEGGGSGGGGGGGGGGSGGGGGGGGELRGRAFPGSFPGRPELCASVEEVAAAVAVLRGGGAGQPQPQPQPQQQVQVRAQAQAAAAAPPCLLGDARAWREYVGDGHDYGCNPNP